MSESEKSDLRRGAVPSEKKDTLQDLLTRLQDRVRKLRAVDPTLARDLQLLCAVLEQHELLITGGALQACEILRRRTVVLASALLVVDQLASARTGALMTAATRAELEQWLLPSANTANVD